MTLGTVMLLTLVCMICRCVIFKKRDIPVIKAIIPGVNKYTLGMLVKSKKLAIMNGIAHTVFWIYFWVCFGFEMWMLSNFAVTVQNPKDGTSQSIVQVVVPENIANIAVWSKYILIAIAVFTIVVWCMMMWKFTMQHKRNPWWILLWAAIPAIPYIYFACISDVVSIDGKRYKLQKVEIE